LAKRNYFGNIFMTPEMLKAFNSSAHRFARSGFLTTPPEILAEREATCRACPEWDAQALNATGRCRKCGCSTWAKLRMATERCPLSKWEAVSEPLQK
jgi:predicted Zn-ribbon and HTH transcriptional regulator